MRVQRNEDDRIDLIKRVVDGKNYYTARLYGDIKPVEVPRMSEDGSSAMHVAYDCDMVITQTELAFEDDTQALYYYDSNFSEEFKVAKYIETFKQRLDESNEARQLLESFDYVSIKMVEAGFKVLKSLYQRRSQGYSITFDEFLDAFMPKLLEIERQKGGNWLEARDDQRKLASFRN